MKNLTKRTKLLLAIAGVLVVVIVAGVVLLQPGATGLFGTTAVHLDPENPTMYFHNYLGMRVSSNALCNWASSNQDIVSINSEFMDQNGIQLWSKNPGTATIEARCGWFNSVHHSTTVTVLPVPVINPANPLIAVGKTVTLSVDAASTGCTWRTLIGPVTVAPTTGSSVVVTGMAHGTGAVEVSCVNGFSQTTVYVQ